LIAHVYDFFFSSRRRHTRSLRDWSSDVCSSDLPIFVGETYSVSATGGLSGNPVTFSSLSTNVCTVSGGTATLIHAGTCVLAADRSEEHTSELQSRRDLVCRLLLEKKK